MSEHRNILLIPEGESAPNTTGIDEVREDPDVTSPKVIQEPPKKDVEYVQRNKVSDESKTAFRDAKAANDLQAQLDILFEILTGEAP